MWLVWVPLVVAWIALPYLAATRSFRAVGGPAVRPRAGLDRTQVGGGGSWPRLPRPHRSSAGCGWGESWRMAVTPGETDRARDQRALRPHPSPDLRAEHSPHALLGGRRADAPMLVVAAIHVALMVVKARNEERFLLGAHGERYAQLLRANRPVFPAPRRGARSSAIGRDDRQRRQGRSLARSRCSRRRYVWSALAGPATARAKDAARGRPAGRGAAADRARPADGGARAGARSRAHLRARVADDARACAGAANHQSSRQRTAGDHAAVRRVPHRHGLSGRTASQPARRERIPTRASPTAASSPACSPGTTSARAWCRC